MASCQNSVPNSKVCNAATELKDGLLNSVSIIFLFWNFNIIWIKTFTQIYLPKKNAAQWIIKGSNKVRFQQFSPSYAKQGWWWLHFFFKASKSLFTILLRCPQRQHKQRVFILLNHPLITTTHPTPATLYGPSKLWIQNPIIRRWNPSHQGDDSSIVNPSKENPRWFPSICT